MTERLIPEDDLKLALSYPVCRKVIRAMLGQLGLFRQPYVAADPTTTAYNCGALNYALAFFDECFSAAPEMTAIMLRELKNDGNNSEREPNNSDDAIVRAVLDFQLGKTDTDPNPFVG